jgi:lipopolysaccharide biosynthesis regulator YciM
LALPYSVAIADANRDGKLDIVYTTSPNASDKNAKSYLRVLLGRGDGTFEEAPAPVTIPWAPYWLVLGDIDADGNVDVGLDRSDLPADRRTMASYELAQDFLRAGMLDRAEGLFAKLTGTPYETQSLAHLISIYEQEKDWAKASEVTGRVAEINRTPAFREIAQYHCELAQAALLRTDEATVRSEIDEALAVHRGCARANLIAGDLAMQLGDPAGALDAWQRIETQNPAFLALVADRVAEACRKLGDRPRAIRLLR